MVLYNQIFLFPCLRWMAGEDVSLFLWVLLGSEGRARMQPKDTATSSCESGDPDRHVAVLMHATGACRQKREQNRMLILCE